MKPSKRRTRDVLYVLGFVLLLLTFLAITLLKKAQFRYGIPFSPGLVNKPVVFIGEVYPEIGPPLLDEEE